MPKLRTVVCEITITGTPEWVDATLSHSAVLPDKDKAMPGCGKLLAQTLQDRTTDLPQDYFDRAIGIKPAGMPEDTGPYPETRPRRR